MDNNNKQLEELAELDCNTIDFDELESKLESELEEQMIDLQGLELDRKKIGNPDSIGETVMNVVWEQFINQVGVVAGEDFIKENRGLKLDIRDSVHIQTTENFANGKIANHNDKIDYQKRYDDWQSNFQRDEKGNIKTHPNRTGKEEATLVSGTRQPFDQRRPTGSAERGTDMDHTVSTGEIIRDPTTNAHLSKEEQIAFANSEANLNEMNASQNRSKGDKSMTDWLDNPNKNGQKPDEIFDISKELDKQYREKDAKAREEYDDIKKEGEQRSIKTGKQSQREEVFRIGGKALRSVIMGLFASLIKDVIRKLIVWFRSGKRKLETFIASVKEAIKSFVSNIKEHLLTAGNTFVTTIATAIFGPVIGMIKKAWIFLKQGYKSIKSAIEFLKNPVNKNMPFSIKMMEVGKLIIVGLTAGGAIVLSEVIEKGLMTIPIFAVQIPLLGSLANLIGMFLGALVSGLIGALALNMIDRMISNRLKKENDKQQLEKKNEIIATQENLNVVTGVQVVAQKAQVATNIVQRHSKAGEYFYELKDAILQHKEASDSLHDSTTKANDDIDKLLENL
ncbi:cation diffusion facilitator family transporter [Bacteroides sp. 224]|uniref:cation diffusion facilitator family transporter n=1 Tax=Bacteroides sp. 224 TaxID=2302936 RepID=UPI0013D0D041|nr:cation diffusion facilitator family transporter [Bacteroides sp. 224]NDV63804.1 cation diffusion facilitator family transporter [Bacteroides sp. 224]